MTIDNLDDADFVEFFYSLASHVLPASSGGHIDVFVPLAASGIFSAMIFFSDYHSLSKCIDTVLC